MDIFEKSKSPLISSRTMKNIEKLSKPLIEILNKIDGKKIKQPIENIKTEYLEYHRKKIFIERETD